MAGKRVNTTATARLKQDYLRITKDPVPFVKAIPLSSNILEWHYIVNGPENSPYEGGIYHGKLVFPREFPFKPPSIYMVTPNGRFKCNTRLCLSISDFHPDTWNPAWSVSTILTGLLSFMLEKSPTLGSIETSDHTKRQLAAQSGLFNLNNKIFNELFPDVVDKIKEDIRKREEEMRNATSNGSQSGTDTRNSSQTVGGGNLARNGIFGSALANVVVIIGFAAFAYTVKLVLKSIVE
ncbi:hypothetical protein ScPMuIL_009613 [Solemya velum]